MASRSIEVRRAVEADLPEVNAIYNHNVRTSHATFDLEERAPEACRAWFEAHRSPIHPVLVAERGGHVIGFASAGVHRARAAYASSVETSVYVDAAALGGGVGRSLYAALFEVLDDHELHRAFAGIAVPNPASVALHLAFGFRLVGRFTEAGRKFARYWDVEWYERSIGHG